MRIETLEELAERIKKVSDVTILTHARPDGDTIGAGFGLCYYLRSVGVRANIKNSDGFPQKFGYLFEGYSDMDFEEKCVISVDVADKKLLGDELSGYADRIDLCIDHHISNRMFAKESYVDGESCATCLILYKLLRIMGAKPSRLIADCLYTGIATDTGCFMYENTSPDAHRAAADLKEFGAKAAEINREMFQIKSKGRILAEQKVIGSMKFFGDSRIALITITNDIIDSYNVDRADLDGFAAIPLTVEGVEIGITLKQQADDPKKFKASVRTVTADASAIAANFDGGGHVRAAGCTLSGTAEDAAEAIAKAAEKYL